MVGRKSVIPPTPKPKKHTPLNMGRRKFLNGRIKFQGFRIRRFIRKIHVDLEQLRELAKKRQTYTVRKQLQLKKWQLERLCDKLEKAYLSQFRDFSELGNQIAAQKTLKKEAEVAYRQFDQFLGTNGDVPPKT